MDFWRAVKQAIHPEAVEIAEQSRKILEESQETRGRANRLICDILGIEMNPNRPSWEQSFGFDREQQHHDA